MATPRPSLQKVILQAQLNKFYAKPVARVSLAVILTIITVGFFAFFAIKPTLETMADLIKQIEEKKDVDQKLSIKITALGAAQQELAKHPEVDSLLTAAIPDTPTIGPLLATFEKVAIENQVSYISANFPETPQERDTTIKGTELNSIPFSVTFSGTYEHLSALISALNNLQRILSIDRLDVVPSTDSQGEELTLTVSLRAYFFSNLPEAKKTNITL